MAILDNTFFGLTGSPDAIKAEEQANELLQRLQMAASAGTGSPSAFLPSLGGMAVTRPPEDNVTTVNKTPRADSQNPQTIAASVDSRYPDSPPPAGPSTTTRPQPQVSSAPPMQRAAGRFPTPAPAAFAGGSAPVSTVQSPDFSPSFGERLQHFGNALTGRETGSLDEQMRSRKATYGALVQMGLTPEQATAAALNPDLLKAVLASKLGTGRGKIEHNKNVMWGKDNRPDSPTFGKTIPVQSSDAGTIDPSKVPEGVEIYDKPQKVDVGTHWGFRSPDGTWTYEKKNLAEAEADKQFGEEAGKARAGLPIAMNNGGDMLKAIDVVEKDPYLDQVVGPFDGSVLSPNLSGDANRVQSRIDQILGKTFLAAFDALRGGGQITEAEGAKATAALARLKNQRMNEADYREALKELREGIVDMINIARRKAAVPALAPEAFKDGDTLKREAGKHYPVVGGDSSGEVRLKQPPPGKVQIGPRGNKQIVDENGDVWEDDGN
jgi:hypothetical protein